MASTLSEAAYTRLTDLLRNYSIELTPGAAKKIDNLQKHLLQKTPVYVTFLPGSEFSDTLALVKRLKDEAYTVIPHIVARSFQSKAHLQDALSTLIEQYGIRHLLLIAGAVNTPLGPFKSSMDILDSGVLDSFSLESLGFAGHPEGSPDMNHEEIMTALRQKNEYAKTAQAHCYLVTQFCFDSAAVIQWAKILQEEKISLPLHIGIPGVGSVRTLIKHAKACGIGPSISFLLKNSQSVTQLLKTATPEKLLLNLVKAEEKGEIHIEKLHFYPLGGLEKTLHWLSAVRTGEWNFVE